MSSAGQVEPATSSYRRAIELAPSDREAAAVKYFFAGHLSRSARDAERAAIVAQEAHEVLSLPRTAFELGRALTYTGDYRGAETALREAMQLGEGRTRLIATTQLIDCLKRRADTEATVDRQPKKAVETFDAAIDVATDLVDEGFIDTRLADKSVSLVSELFKVVARCPDAQFTEDTLIKALAVIDELGPDARRSPSFDYLKSHARRLMWRHPDLSDAVNLIAKYAVSDQEGGPVHELSRERDEHALLGSIKVWKPDRHFGFISTLDRKDDLFFHLAALSSPADEIRLRPAASVRFNRSIGADGRFQAQDVHVEESTDHTLVHRHLIVDGLHLSGNCVFSRRH